VVSVTAFMALRMASYTAVFAANMMYWDQWDFYARLFTNSDLFQIFRYQHGPHRQGLGGLLIALVAALTNWDSRGDSALSAGALFVAAILALVLRRRVGGPWRLTDVWIPIAFLSLNQWETLVLIPNAAHSALPLALILAAALALTITNERVSALALCVLHPLLMHTGFAICGAFAVSAVLLLRTFEHLKSTDIAALRSPWAAAFAWSTLSIVVFFIGWRFNTAAPCFVFPHPRPLEYGLFALLMLSNAFAVVPHTDQIGQLFLAGGLGLLTTGACAAACIRPGRGSSASAVQMLAFSSGAFIAFTAVGRVCFDALDTPLASKYATLCLPLLLAVYVWALQQQPRVAHGVAALFAAAIALSFLPPFYRDPTAGAPPYVRDLRNAWAECYRRIGDAFECDRIVGQPVYPNTRSILRRLQLLEAGRRSLFIGQPHRELALRDPDASEVTGGSLAIRGTIDAADFMQYEVRWGVGDSPTEWHWISGPHLAPVRDGIVTTWKIDDLPAGKYVVRVDAVFRNGDERVLRAFFVR
jgi:hypothetical protein